MAAPRKGSQATAPASCIFCCFFRAPMQRMQRQAKGETSVQDFGAAFGLAFELIGRADPDLLQIVYLSVRVSLGAVALACLIGMPLGALLAVARFSRVFGAASWSRRAESLVQMEAGGSSSGMLARPCTTPSAPRRSWRQSSQ